MAGERHGMCELAFTVTPNPVAARSTAWVCGCSTAEIAFRIPQEAWKFVCCEWCVLSGRGRCDELITLPDESYRLWCVVLCDLETSWMKRPWPTGGAVAPNTFNTETWANVCLGGSVGQDAANLYISLKMKLTRQCNFVTARHDVLLQQ